MSAAATGPRKVRRIELPGWQQSATRSRAGADATPGPMPRRDDAEIAAPRSPEAPDPPTRVPLTNDRGAKVQSAPEAAIPEVPMRLSRAAARAGKLPGQGGCRMAGSSVAIWHPTAPGVRPPG